MTQKMQVIRAVSKGMKRPKAISDHLEIVEPNVRRILGVGAKDGIFERVGRGVYVLTTKGQKLAYIYSGDAAETLERMADEGLKVDAVFLDPPYNSAAVRGGNRGIKFDTITPKEYRRIMEAIMRLLRTEDTPVYYMYSRAPSGWKQMQKYNEVMEEVGLKTIYEGNLFKLQKDGKTRCRNMRGDVIVPEAVVLMNQSGRFSETEQERSLEFSCIRPKGYQTEKPAEMLNSIVMQSTWEGDVILDPFAGSGVTGAEAVKANRVAILIDKSKSAIEEFILPRLKEAAANIQLPEQQLAFNF